MISRNAAVLVCLLALVSGAALCAPSAAAQTWPVTMGTVATPSPVTGGCPALGRGFYQDPNPSDTVTCWETSVSGCTGDDPMNLYYEVDTPPGTLLGTIVMLGPGDGVNIPPTFSLYYLPAYLGAGYQVIEVSWGVGAGGNGQPWEVTTFSGLNPNNASIGLGACRVATFLNWIRNGNLTCPTCRIWAGQGGMCVHANSGGAGALAYVLTYYHAGYGGQSVWGSGYVDKAVMENGPVFSAIDQGCEYTNGVNSQNTYICAGPGYGTTELGCNNWPQGTNATDYGLEYIDPDYKSVNVWSGSPTPGCGLNVGTTSNNDNWNNMGILAKFGSNPNFNYPNTAISGWLCSGVTMGVNNNAGAQGQLWFQQFANPGSGTAGLSVNGVSSCPGAEEIETGYTNVNGVPYNGNAWQAIVNDMTTGILSCHALGIARPQ